MITNYEIQDIAMNLIISGYACAETAARKAEAIYQGMLTIANLNAAAVVESEKCEVYRKKWKNTYGTKFLVKSELVSVDTSSMRAENLLKLKDVEWKMMKDVTGLDEFQIMEVC